VAALTKKPGALRNGAPFKDWVLPGSIEEVRVKLGRSDEGDRQMVKILAAWPLLRQPSRSAFSSLPTFAGDGGELQINLLILRAD
jgi:hypothetical protein